MAKGHRYADPPLSGIEQWWRDVIPYWLQWILFLPASMATGALLPYLVVMPIMGEDLIGCFSSVLRFLLPAGAFVAFLISVWTTVPRGKYEICIAIFSIRAIIDAVVITATVLIVSGLWKIETDESSYQLLRSATGEIIAIAAGAYTIHALRQAAVTATLSAESDEDSTPRNKTIDQENDEYDFDL